MAKTEIGIFTDAYIRQDKTLPFVVVEDALPSRMNLDDFRLYWKSNSMKFDESANLNRSFLDSSLACLRSLNDIDLIEPSEIELPFDTINLDLSSRIDIYNTILENFVYPDFSESSPKFQPKAEGLRNGVFSGSVVGGSMIIGTQLISPLFDAPPELSNLADVTGALSGFTAAFGFLYYLVKK